MAGLRDVLGGVYRRDDPTEGENEATMLEEPPVDDDVADTDASLSGWGFDDDDVPDLPDVVDVDASALVPGAEIDWEAATAAEPALGDAVDDVADVDAGAPAAPKVFDLDEDGHGAPAWDVPDDDVRSVVTSAFADLDLLDDDPSIGWDAETVGAAADADGFDVADEIELTDDDIDSTPVAAGAHPWIRADDDIVPPDGKRRSLFRRG